jgi:hypothetical protein
MSKNLFSSLGEYLEARAPKVETDLAHRGWTSTRWLLVLAFGGLVIWWSAGELITDSLHMIFWLVVTYLICNTATRIAQYAANAYVRGKVMPLMLKDGKLDADEKAALE